MRDPLDVLRGTSTPVAPDPAFRAALLRTMTAALRDTSRDSSDDVSDDISGGAPIEPADPWAGLEVAAPDTSRSRRWQLVAVLAAAAAILVFALLNPAGDSTVPTETTSGPSTSTTVFVNPFSDAEVADRMLLGPNEYGPNWRLGLSKDVVLDGSIAATVPGCAAYVDVVFESERRPAETSWRFYQSPEGSPAALMSQYVVVFPTEDAAIAMFDATVDPAFLSDCFTQYKQLTADPTGFCCNPAVAFPAALAGEHVPGSDVVGADQIDHRTAMETWKDAEGTTHGPERIDSVTMRVGRTITVIEAIKTDEFGQTYLTDEQFNRALTTLVDHTDRALRGVGP